MVEIWVPYGKTEVPVTVNVENLKGVLRPQNMKENPSNGDNDFSNMQIEFKELCELVDKSDTVSICIECTDSFEFLVSSINPIINELYKAGVKDDNLSVLLATGEKGRIDEGRALKFLKVLPPNIQVQTHDCNSRDLTHIGSTSSGNEIFLNKNFMDSTFRIIVSMGRPHYATGYSGIERVILPGLAGIEAILFNTKMSLNPDSKPGKLKGNPVYEDIKEVFEMTHPDYAINTIFKGNMYLDKIFSGKAKDVLYESTSYIEDVSKIRIDEKQEAIILSAGGNFYDRNLYQAIDSLYNIHELLEEENVVILISECLDGYGNSNFYNFIQNFGNKKNSNEFEKKINENFKIGYEKAYFLIKILQMIKIFLVSILPNSYIKNIFGVKYAETANEALRMASRTIGKDFNSLVVPYGSLTIPIFS